MCARRVAAGVTGGVALATVRRLGRRSGPLTAADLAGSLPGDDVVTPSFHTVDRAVVLAAPPAAVWPWLVQLGKGRGGWYAPGWLERAIPVARRGSRVIRPELGRLVVGDVVPDWGPASLELLARDEGSHLVYGGIHPGDPGAGGPMMSWLILLRPVDGGRSRLLMRLRFRRPRRLLLRVALPAVGGFVDYLTMVALFAGLRERLASGSPSDAG